MFNFRDCGAVGRLTSAFFLSSHNDCVLPSMVIVTGIGQVCLDVPPVRRNLSCSSVSLPSTKVALRTGKPSWLIQPSMIRLTSVPDAAWRLDQRSCPEALL